MFMFLRRLLAVLLVEMYLGFVESGFISQADWRIEQDFRTLAGRMPALPKRGGTAKGLGAEVEELAHVAELLVAGVEEFLDALVGEDEELALEGVAENLGGGIVVAVGAAVGFGDDFVDDAEFFKIRGHDLHGDGGGFRLCGIAPDDGCATFRGDYGIEAVFEDVDAVAESNGQRA